MLIFILQKSTTLSPKRQSTTMWHKPILARVLESHLASLLPRILPRAESAARFPSRVLKSVEDISRANCRMVEGQYTARRLCTCCSWWSMGGHELDAKHDSMAHGSVFLYFFLQYFCCVLVVRCLPLSCLL